MSHKGPLIGNEDVFEGLYTERFRSLVRGQGEFVQYERDRASLDIGLHLTTPSGAAHRVSHTRIWFQLKGLHKRTLPLREYKRAMNIGISISLEKLKFWFASPEPIYLAVYIEAADNFLAEDVRELVYRRWGEDFLAPTTFPEDRRDVTVRIPTSSLLTPERLALMRRHQLMRIDGPYFRGRPLGHRLDPLRCSLSKLPPSVYVSLVQRLLAVHDYRISESLNPADLFPGEILADEHALLVLGRLYTTFEWVPQLFTEFGIGPADDFRIEGEPQFAHGPTAVLIHGNPRSLPTLQALHIFARSLLDQGIRRFMVFANTNDQAYFGSFFASFRTTGVQCVPQLLGDLAYSLLTATVVYLEFREAVSWQWSNYLWAPAGTE